MSLQYAPREQQPILRKPRESDRYHLAELIIQAGDPPPGFPWKPRRGKLVDFAARRLAFRCETFCLKHALVCEVEGRVAGMVLGYRLAAQGETPKVAGLCPSLKPLSSLNGRHEASFYVNTLAIYPEARGSGLGTLLLESAERKARKAHCAGMLLEVFADNERAMRLYERHGFSPMPSVPSIASEDEPEVVVLEKIISRSPAEVCCAGTTCQHRANGPGICSRAELFDG